jgi:hypothetical protein
LKLKQNQMHVEYKRPSHRLPLTVQNQPTQNVCWIGNRHEAKEISTSSDFRQGECYHKKRVDQLIPNIDDGIDLTSLDDNIAEQEECTWTVSVVRAEHCACIKSNWTTWHRISKHRKNT